MATRSGREGYVPERGDAVWLSLDPQAGHEQAGRRPCVMLTPSRYNRASGLGLFVPVTTRIKGYPFEIILPDGFAVSGAVLTDQIRNLDGHARNAELIVALPRDVVGQILRRTTLPLQP